MRATPEHAWLAADSRLVVASWVATRALVPARCRLVVLAPHPDDETLMAGGLIASLPAGRVLLVAATDGEASHGADDVARCALLAKRRMREQMLAFARLGHAETCIARLGLPDGELAGHEDTLLDRLREIVEPGDILLTTVPFDGHPDHEACGRACRRAQQLIGCGLLYAPVWMWHWQTPQSDLPFDRLRRLPLSEDQQMTKAAALACFHSQLDADPHIAGTPIVPPEALAHFNRSFETYIQP